MEKAVPGNSKKNLGSTKHSNILIRPHMVGPKTDIAL